MHFFRSTNILSLFFLHTHKKRSLNEVMMMGPLECMGLMSLEMRPKGGRKKEISASADRQTKYLLNRVFLPHFPAEEESSTSLFGWRKAPFFLLPSPFHTKGDFQGTRNVRRSNLIHSTTHLHTTRRIPLFSFTQYIKKVQK